MGITGNRSHTTEVTESLAKGQARPFQANCAKLEPLGVHPGFVVKCPR
jgi:hypothetical protein